MKKLLALASMLTIDMAGCDELRLPKCEQQYDANCINRHMKATREQTQDVVCYNIAAYDSGKIDSNDAAVQGYERTLSRRDSFF